MSLRIYIKETPKFHSSKRLDHSLPLSPQFNSFTTNKNLNQQKRTNTFTNESKDLPSVHESSQQKEEILSQSLRDHNISSSTQALLNPYTYNYDADKFTSLKQIEEENFRRIEPEIQSLVEKILIQMDNLEYLTDRQLRELVKDSKQAIIALLEENEKYNAARIQKSRENEILIDSIQQLNQELKGMTLNAGITDSFEMNLEEKYRYNKDYPEQESFQRLIDENLNIIDRIKKNNKSNTELVEEVSLLREMANTGEKALQKERESFKKLKSKVEELLKINDDLNEKLNKLDKTGRNYDHFDELKKSLIVADFQSPQHPRKLEDDINNQAPNSLFGASTNLWNTLKGESPADYKKKEESIDLKKHEEVKNENVRLLKIIEGNQQIIKNLQQSLADLDKRNNMRLDEMKYIYEAKIRMLSDKDLQKVPFY